MIGDGSTSPGSLPGNVAINSTTAGALTFNTPASMSITASGNISGRDGGLTKTGAGLLILSGNNTYTGRRRSMAERCRSATAEAARA